MAAADGTLLTMSTALGDGVLQPIGLHAEEAISKLFAFSVRAVSQQKNLNADAVLYQPACVSLRRPVGQDRHFHGIVQSFTGGDMWGAAFLYHLEIVPKLWFASQTSDCRVFHKKSTKDIIDVILKENGITDISYKIQGDQSPYDFVAQYNETDLAFITRLMEAEGYSYFFEFSENKHVLVISDNNTAFTAVSSAKMLIADKATTLDAVTTWRRTNTTAVGKVKLSDYDPLKPSSPVDGEQSTVLTTAGTSVRDVYEWPARTDKTATSTSRARLRQEIAEAQAGLIDATGYNHEFYPGGKFTLAAGPSKLEIEGDYGIQAVVHDAIDEVHANTGAITDYANSFVTFPIATKWRPPIVQPRPNMAGLFSGIVVGVDGEEIDTEEYGRIKVRLFWDHRKDATGDTTIWVRVLQPWSGDGWGWQHIPRVGTEVAIAFIDGDIDQPIVVGCLYNGEQKPPFSLPGDKTKSGIRTRSSLKGGASNYSELSFDDKKGSELVLLHAEKDLSVEVENDQKTHIEGAQTDTVDKGRATTISNKDDTLEVSKGDISVKAALGKITVEAMQSIELKVGANSIKIDQSGITVSGTMVKIEGTALLDLKGAMAQLTGDAMTTIKGGIVMVN
jgi:type VI secretion system secreted protein VgrG